MFLLLAWIACLIGSDAVEREWTLRAWALEPLAHRAELEAALVDESWERRHAALDALGRAAPDVLWSAVREHAARARVDPHPNVRRQGLVLTGALGLELPSEEVERLARDPFADVRYELVVLLRFAHAAPSTDQVLLELSRDPDRRVARAAVGALLQRGPEALDAQLALETELRRRAGLAGELYVLEFVERAPANAGLLEASIPERDPALWRALASARLGRGDAQQLVDGWFGGAGRIERDHELARRALLQRAARAFDAEVAAQLIAGSLALDRFAHGEQDALDAWPGLRGAALEREPAELASELLYGALATGARGSAAVLERLPELSSGLRAAAWEGLLGRDRAWSRALELGRIAAESDPDARFAAAGGLAEYFSRSGDERAGDALVRLLADPDGAVRAEAFRTLAARGEARWHPALFDAWSALAGRERLLALRELSRAAPPTPFRAELIAMWEEPRARNASVLELLASFRDDPDLALRMEGWLDLELAWLAAQEPPAEPQTAGAWRAAEERIKGLSGALARARGAAAVPALERVLAQSDGRSEEVAKTVAALLGRTSRGRELLFDWMQREASARVRIEAALQVGREHPAEAVTLLLEQYPTCDEELRVRSLRLFGVLEDPRCAPFCGAVASARGHGAPERVIALEALSASPDGEGARAALTELLSSAPDLDVLRGAIAAIGERGDAGALPALLELDARAERREHLQDELLPALTRLDPDAASEVLFAAPLAAAAEELEGRFRSMRLPAREFAWRGELAAAQELARTGRLGAALESAGPWWRLDGRLLVALGDAALEGAGPGSKDAARRLFHAARAGLAGEAPATDLEGHRTRARARGLALAIAAGDWREARRLARELLGGWRSGDISRREWDEVLGRRDGDLGRDPLGWVVASELQAAARLALEDGRLERARALAARAAQAGAGSAAAARQQAALERALAVDGR